MDQTRTTETSKATPIGRRTMLAGAAWSVPAISIVAATPAFAATGDTVTFKTVTVNTAPTVPPAPSAYYINTSNPNSTVTVSGNVTAGAIVTVAWGSTSGVATTTGTSWTLTIPAASLPQGTISFTASVAGPPPVSKPGPQSVIKDTVAPQPTVTTDSYIGGTTKSWTINGTMGNATTGTADSATGTLSWDGGTFDGYTSPVTVTRTGTTWSHTFGNVTNNTTRSFTITQTDGAGNSGASVAVEHTS